MNSEQSFMAFGRYLKSMRTQMGIPLDEVAEEIRISRRQLAVIEEEDHDQLPDAVYVKGILRAYASYIGVDADDIVDRYMINRDEYVRRHKGRSLFSRVSKKWVIRIALLTGLLTMIIVLALYLIYGSQTNPLRQPVDDAGAGTAPVAETVEVPPAALIPPAALSPPAESGAETAAQKLFLQIDAVEDTELEIAVDDSDPVHYLLHPMDHMELEAEANVALKISNAAGVNLLLNNKPVTISGESGQAVYIELP